MRERGEDKSIEGGRREEGIGEREESVWEKEPFEIIDRNQLPRIKLVILPLSSHTVTDSQIFLYKTTHKQTWLCTM